MAAQAYLASHTMHNEQMWIMMFTSLAVVHDNVSEPAVWILGTQVFITIVEMGLLFHCGYLFVVSAYTRLKHLRLH